MVHNGYWVSRKSTVKSFIDVKNFPLRVPTVYDWLSGYPSCTFPILNVSERKKAIALLFAGFTSNMKMNIATLQFSSYSFQIKPITFHWFPECFLKAHFRSARLNVEIFSEHNCWRHNLSCSTILTIKNQINLYKE